MPFLSIPLPWHDIDPPIGNSIDLIDTDDYRDIFRQFHPDDLDREWNFAPLPNDNL